MTKRERNKVVEILRCAADLVTKTKRPISHAAMYLGITDGHPLTKVALGVRGEIAWSVPIDDEVYRAQILEAALRIEEGRSP